MATAAQAVSGLHVLESNADAEASTTTSPLSEVEDRDGLPDEMDDVVLEAEKPPIHDDDSDSNLSDAGNDTEAETERMFDTPQVQRHRSVILGQFNRDHIEKTPTRPNGRTANSPTVGSDLDDSYASDIPHSPLPRVSVKLANQKRKRSPDTDILGSGQPHLKRSVSGTLNGKADAHTSTFRITVSSSNPTNGISSHDNMGAPSKDLKRPSGTRSCHVSPDRHQEVSTEDGNGAHSDHDADIDEEAEAALRNEEELEKKRIAIEEWNAIEARFVTFRDKLYKDRLEKLEKEEQSLLAKEPYHPEYLAMMQCINDRYNKKMKHINKQFEYALKAQEETAVSTRTQIWSQFYQAMREKREEYLGILQRDWYDTQLVRRRAHSVPDVALMFPSSPTQQTRNAIAYSAEVSILSGMAKHIGFPAVPHMHGATDVEMEDDFNAMKAIMYESQRHFDPTYSEAPPPPRQARILPTTRGRPPARTSMSTSAEDAAAAAVLSAPMSAQGPAHVQNSAPQRNLSVTSQNTGNSRRASQAKSKETNVAHSTTASKSRMPNHVANGISPPLRPPVDAARS